MMTGFGVILSWKEGFLVHGGVSRPTSTSPKSALTHVVVTSDSKNASHVDDLEKGCEPVSLSHHGGCLIKNGEVLVLVGGWTGKRRSNTIHVFNLKQKQWIRIKEWPDGRGRVPPPVGLSGHTATAINDNLICVLGREGGIKTQRRFGDLFLLNLDIARGLYWYSEAPYKPTSRSGHTALLLPSLKGSTTTFGLFVFGGRDSGSAEMCGQWSQSEVNPEFAEIPKKSRLRDVIIAWCHHVEETEVMIGLRRHAMAAVAPDCVLVHGGEHFKTKPPGNISSTLFACVTGSRWFPIPTEPEIPRFAHSMFIVGEEIFLVGGFATNSDKKPATVQKIVIPNVENLNLAQND